MTRTLRPQLGRRCGLGLAAAAVVSTLLVSGCGSAQAGAAAVVGDRRISVASVQSGYDSILSLAGPDAGFTQSVILNYLILGPYLERAASDLGRGISTHDAELQFQIDSSVQSPSPPALDVMRALAANQAIRQGRTEQEYNATYQQISDELKAARVHINPRYGAGIDYEVGTESTLTIRPEQQDWIASSTPAPSATAPGGTDSPESTPTP